MHLDEFQLEQIINNTSQIFSNPEFDKQRREDTQATLRLVIDYMESNPHLRFWQAMSILFPGTELDIWGSSLFQEESSRTLSRLETRIEQLNANKSQDK